MAETRKVQVTGGSTYTVSIPKEWATENGVSAGSKVAFHPLGDRLLLSPRTEDERAEGTIDITGLEGEALRRAVTTMYVGGFDRIRLESSRIGTDQRRTIRQATEGLVGIEVLEETGGRVVVRDLLDSSELSIRDAVTRMRLVALSMLADAVDAVATGDDDLARDVVERDDDVDRLWLVVSRIVRTSIRNPAAAKRLGLPPEAAFDYHAVARQLERIADHATKVAGLGRELDEPLPSAVAESLRELHAAAVSVVEDAMDALAVRESAEATRLANDARAAVQDVDKRVRGLDDQLRELDPGTAKQLGLVVDSLSRSADYGGNIAETALQRAGPTP